MRNINKKEMLNNLKINIKNGKKFYKFSHITLDGDKIYFDGKNPYLLYGINIPVFIEKKNLPIQIYDIAYETDGRLYQILTNQEVKVVHEGINELKDNQILAAKTISPATKSELEEYVSIITQRNNIKSYVKSKKQL